MKTAYRNCNECIFACTKHLPRDIASPPAFGLYCNYWDIFIIGYSEGEFPPAFCSGCFDIKMKNKEGGI